MTAEAADREADADRTRSAATQARCIAVRVGEALYGLPMQDVQEVISMRPVTRVFHAPDALAGVTNLRGDVLPVLELGVLLGGAPIAETAHARIVVVRENGGLKRRAGLRVDELRGLRELPAQSELLPAPATANERARAAIVGVIRDPPPCSVLSVVALFDSPLIAELGVAGAGSEGA